MAELDKINVNGELYDMSDSKARSDIASEITNRTNADKALDDKVKAETEARTSADNALNQKIVQETTDRTNADNALQEKINTNKTGIDNLVNDVAIRNVKAEEVTNVPEVKLPLDEVKEEIEAAGNRVLNSIPDDYTQINNKVSELKGDLDEMIFNSKNLLNNKTITLDKNFKSNSTEIIDATDYTLTDYIEVSYGETLYFSRYSISSNESILRALARIVEYDANKNPISNAVESKTTFTPSKTNCKYIRATFISANNIDDKKTMISKSSDITYEEYYKKIAKEFLPEIPNYQFDDIPTKDSENLLTSGAIYNAFQSENSLYDCFLPLGKTIKETVTHTYMSDMCIVNDDLWVFNASADYQTTPTDDILSYAKVSILNKDNGNEKSHFFQNFGHCNSVSYRKDDDSLIFGNGSTKAIDDLFTKRCFYIIQDITDVLNNAPVDSDGSITGEVGAKYIDLMTHAIEYDVTDFGFKCNAIFGSLPRNVLVITNDGTKVKELILGRETVDFGNGTFISGKTGNQYNGTYKIINEWSIDNFPDVVQGAEYKNGYIYFGVGHSDRWICRAKLTSKPNLELESYKDILYSNGGVKTSQTSSGITFDGDRMMLICGAGTLLEYPLIS